MISLTQLFMREKPLLKIMIAAGLIFILLIAWLGSQSRKKITNKRETPVNQEMASKSDTAPAETRKLVRVECDYPDYPYNMRVFIDPTNDVVVDWRLGQN